MGKYISQVKKGVDVSVCIHISYQEYERSLGWLSLWNCLHCATSWVILNYSLNSSNFQFPPLSTNGLYFLIFYWVI